MDFLWAIIIGGLAGWLASLLMKGRGLGIIGNIIIGIIGAVLADWLFGLLGLSLGFFFEALIGAIILLFFASLVKQPDTI
jgi:uncharacterized membrane protein YeaQ/YmgE (transglycosylase-associated protein family)